MVQLGRAACWTTLIAVLIFLFAPIAIVVAVSFSPSSVFAFPPDGFSLRWYHTALEADALLSSIWLSVQIALLSTAISLALGTLCAIAIVRRMIPGGEIIATFMASPLMLPGLVLGIAFLQASRQFGLYDTYTTLLLAHVVITMPFVMRTVLASLSLFDFTLIDAARTLGLSYPKAVLKVLVPSLAPAFLTSGMFAFLASMDNYPISIFFTDAWTKTLPIQMLQYVEESPDPTIAAISALLILLAAAVLVIGDRLVGLRRMADL